MLSAANVLEIVEYAIGFSKWKHDHADWHTDTQTHRHARTETHKQKRRCTRTFSEPRTHSQLLRVFSLLLSSALKRFSDILLHFFSWNTSFTIVFQRHSRMQARRETRMCSSWRDAYEQLRNHRSAVFCFSLATSFIPEVIAHGMQSASWVRTLAVDSKQWNQSANVCRNLGDS